MRMRRRFWLHGLLWWLAALCAVLLVHYGLDRSLVLPGAVRILLIVAGLVYLGFGLRRRLLYPLGIRFEDRDIALWVERNHPELHQELISAVQLGSGPLPKDASPQLAQHLIDQVADKLGKLRFDNMLRPERTRRVGASAGVLALLVLGTAALSPESFGIWLQRLTGMSIDYPRATFLSIQVSTEQANVAIRADEPGEPLQIDVARGSDLPINVDVEGSVPDFVELVARSESGDERVLFMTKRGERRFRYVIRRVLEPTILYARGGDDPGTRRIEAQVLIPPAATGLEVVVTPPAYTQLEPIVSQGGLVEALPGSEVSVTLQASVELESGALVFQESAAKVELRRVPARPEDVARTGATGSEDVETVFRYEGRFAMPETSDRYQVEMLAKNGLSELGGAVYSVVPRPDRQPLVRVITPGPSFPAMTPDAVFPLRLVATDDYGLVSLSLARRLGSRGEMQSEELWALGSPAQKGRASQGEAVEAEAPTGPRRRFEMLELFSPQQFAPPAEPGAEEGAASRAPREGDRLEFQILARDNREPEGQEGAPQGFRIDLVALDELRRRLQSRLRSTRRAVERTRKVQEEQRDRLDALLAELAKEAGVERLGFALTAAEAGQQRVRSSLSRVRSDFCEVLDAHLFNGLDSSPAAKDVVDAYLRWYRQQPEAQASDPRFWNTVQEQRREARIGQLELLGRLGDMFALSDLLVEQRLPASLSTLAKASTAPDDSALQQSLVELRNEHERILRELDQLLTLLEDWNEYQDVIRMTRQIRDSLKDLMERVRGDFGTRRR
jgi:mRNA-degrading endonuclease RelE of RelBE toxin-antitoxin system